MSYDILHFDAKLSIARTSIAAWNALMCADPTFGRYALTDQGQSAFLAALTVVEDGKWAVGGKLHRIDGPAHIDADGTKMWYERNQRHRIGGPAVTYAAGSKLWFEHNQLHRIDGPAVTYANGTKMWYIRDELHRIGGPAIMYANGREVWYDHGKMISPRQSCTHDEERHRHAD